MHLADAIHFHILFLDGVYVYRDGTTQVAFDPVDFIARLAALVPKPRVNLTRYHGVLAPNHRWRGLVTPAKRGKGAMRPVDSDVVSSIQRHAAMTWAQRLKRVFNIDIDVCDRGATILGIFCTVGFAWMSRTVHPAVQKLVSSSERRRTLVDGSACSMA